jgi:hypothetical protein
LPEHERASQRRSSAKPLRAFESGHVFVIAPVTDKKSSSSCAPHPRPKLY